MNTHEEFTRMNINEGVQIMTIQSDGKKSIADTNVLEFTPKFSEDYLALKFADRYRDELQFIDERGRWALWTGKRWKISNASVAFARARHICRREATKVDSESMRRTLVKAATVAAVERLARVDDRLLSHNNSWDPDPWLLNTPEGVVNLKTDDLVPHDPAYRMTRITRVSPRPMKTPRWRKFLKEITDDDDDLIDFLQRLFGYSLTGLTMEHVLAFFYGPGGNGKSVLLHTVANILGDYHISAPMEVFVESRFERHSTELARLAGARLVTAHETERGRRWAEARIKALSAGEPVVARFMRQDDFEYIPQFQLLFSGNHRPALRSVDEAIRRRLRLVPFDVVIPEEKRDTELEQKLRSEWPGILEWMIEGTAKWRESGLTTPDRVEDATEEYLKSEDHYSVWMEERCKRDPNVWRPRTEIYASWRQWAAENNVPVGPSSDFYDHLEQIGFQVTIRHGVRGFKGLTF